MSWGNDDVFLGDEDYLGESLRGPQRTDYLGNYEIGAAQRQLSNIRGQLGQLARNQAMSKFARHAPMQQRVRPAYKDSTQFGIECSGTFAVAAWSNSNTTLPTVTGKTRVYESFKSAKVISDEQLILTYSNDSLGDTSIAVDVSDAGDLKLIGVFAGAKNCFPTAPDQSTGISGRALANNSLGNGISWPTVNGGIDVVITFAVRRTAIYRGTPPTGYTSADLSTVEVLATLNLFGESLRP